MPATFISESMRREQVGRQTIVLPSNAEWAALLTVGLLDDLPLVSEAVARRWLASFGHLKEAGLGLYIQTGKWWAAPLLKLRGRYYHVHFEDVICEHCGRRCGLSATPQPASYFNMSFSDAWKEFSPYPVLPCPHCGELLRRRQTFWFAEPQQN
jgi:hypothetical protein